MDKAAAGPSTSLTDPAWDSPGRYQSPLMGLSPKELAAAGHPALTSPSGVYGWSPIFLLAHLGLFIRGLTSMPSFPVPSFSIPCRPLFWGLWKGPIPPQVSPWHLGPGHPLTLSLERGGGSPAFRKQLPSSLAGSASISVDSPSLYQCFQTCLTRAGGALIKGAGPALLNLPTEKNLGGRHCPFSKWWWSAAVPGGEFVF